jgi:hypothetical protein
MKSFVLSMGRVKSRGNFLDEKMNVFKSKPWESYVRDRNSNGW